MSEASPALPGPTHAPAAGPPPPSPILPATPEQSVRRMTRLVPLAVGLSVASIVAITLVVQTRRSVDVAGDLEGFRWAFLPLALGLHLLMQAWWGLRFGLLARALGAPVGHATAQGLVTGGLFAAAVTPGRVGGEPFRIALLVRRGHGGAAASRTVLADRATDMLFFMALGLLVALLLPSLFGDDGRALRITSLVALAGLVAMATVLVLILVRPRPMAWAFAGIAARWDRLRRREPRDRTAPILAFFQEVTGGLGGLLRTRKGVVATAVLLSLLLWTSEFTVLWIVLRGFGHPIPFVAVYAVGVVVTMVASVPALPGGSGLAEGTAFAILAAYDPLVSPAFLLVWRGMTYYMDLALGGAVAAAMVRRQRRAAPVAP